MTFNCEKCNYITEDAGNWSKHLKTKKHNDMSLTKELTLIQQAKLEQQRLKDESKMKLEKEKFELKLQLEKDKLEQKKKKDEELLKIKQMKDEEKKLAEETKMQLQREKLEQKKKKDEELLKLKQMKEEAKKQKEEEKTKIINWDDFCYDTIKSDISFNFKQTILGKKDNFFEELLIHILDNPRFRCMRIVDNELQLFNDTWMTHMFNEVDDDDLKYDISDVLEKLKEIGSEFSDSMKYKYQYGVACNGSTNPNVRLKTLKQIIKNKDLGFDFYYDQLKEEQEQRNEKILRERQLEAQELIEKMEKKRLEIELEMDL